MKPSIILQTAAKFLVGLIFLYSIFLLFRGHHSIGGGFAGGLTAGCAYALQSVAYGTEHLKKLFRFHPFYIIAGGFFLALLSGAFAMLLSEPFMTGQWVQFYVGEAKIKFGTPILFDIGVYLIVLGSIVVGIIRIEEEV